MNNQAFNQDNINRPTHETYSDRLREHECIKRVADFHGINYTLFPKMYPIDAAFYHSTGKLRALVEHRSRNIKHNQYQEIPLTMSKYAQGQFLSSLYNVPFVILWEFADGVFWKQVPSGLDVIFFHGNTGSKDRGDPYDQEPVVLIPTDGMTRAIFEVV